MNIVIAIDSFKGSLTSIEAGSACRDGILRAFPDAKITVRPLADGGEGTTEALAVGMNGRHRTARAHDAVMRECDCTYCITGS